MALLLCLVLLSQVHADAPFAYTGDNSLITKPQMVLASTPDQWKEIWERHTGNKSDRSSKQIPWVSFQSHVVLCIFGGKVGQQAGYTLLEAAPVGDKLRVRYVPQYFSVGFNPRQKVDWSRTPYAFVVVSRRYTAVVLEEGIIKSKVDPPTEFRYVEELGMPER